jgi:hypothetical protein
MKIFFAGSIRGGRDDQGLYDAIIETLSTYGEVLNKHVADKKLTIWGEVGIEEVAIYNREMGRLEETDIIIAEVTTPSLGIGYELGKFDDKKPVLCIYRKQEGRRVSGMVMGNQLLTIKEYTDIEDLKKIFAEFFRKK